MDQFIPGLRAHRVIANLLRQMDLPPGTDSINIPKLSNLTTVGYQQANNAGLPSTDWSDTSVQANVKTVGGYSDVAIQVLDLSPHQIVDEVITADLMAAYDLFLDQQVATGDGLNASGLNSGHLQGFYNGAGGSAWSNVNGVTYTQGTPSAQGFIPSLACMPSKIGRTRFQADMSQYKIVMHGRRWFWYAASLDGSYRPLGETAAGGRFNIAAAVAAGMPAEGLVGTLPFLSDTPVYADYNFPTTDATGGAANEDIVLGGLFDDAWLFSGDLRTQVYNEILSASLGVRYQLWNYHAMLLRYGQSFAIMTGTGLAAPSTGYGDTF